MSEEKVSEIPENIDEIFAAAVDIVQAMPKEGPLSVANTEKLKFYSLYKQGSEGPCNKPQPPFWQPLEKIKWQGWNSLKDMDPNLAKHIYVKKMQKMIDKVYETHDISKLLASNPDYDIKEMDPILRPKFKLIGRELLSPDETDKLSTPGSNPETSTEVIKEETPIRKDDITGSISDDEYTDAWEAPVIPTSDQLPENVVSLSICNMNSQMRLLSEQVKHLGTIVMEQNKIINKYMKEIATTRHQRGVGGLSWWMFALIILWPFFVKYIFQNLVKIIFSLI